MNSHPGISPLLFSFAHHSHESCELRAGAQKIRRSNDAIEFRNEDSVSSAVVSDENISVPEVFFCCVGNVVGIRHFRRGIACTHVLPHGFFVSPESPSCVYNSTLRKLKHAACTRKKYSLRSCSNLELFARSSAYEFQFVPTPHECAPAARFAPQSQAAGAIHDPAGRNSVARQSQCHTQLPAPAIHKSAIPSVDSRGSV